MTGRPWRKGRRPGRQGVQAGTGPPGHLAGGHACSSAIRTACCFRGRRDIRDALVSHGDSFLPMALSSSPSVACVSGQLFGSHGGRRKDVASLWCLLYRDKQSPGAPCLLPGQGSFIKIAATDRVFIMCWPVC